MTVKAFRELLQGADPDAELVLALARIEGLETSEEFDIVGTVEKNITTDADIEKLVIIHITRKP